jgi:hypothetical protein
MWRRPKLKNAFVAIFSEKDLLLDVLNDHHDHILRVLSTSTNMPEMIEKQKYVSFVAAYVIQLELWCATSLDEPLQEITARFAQLRQNIDEEVCSNSADIVEIVERNVGYHLNKVIFEHESVSAVEFPDIVPTCVRSSLSTQERSVDADIADFGLACRKESSRHQPRSTWRASALLYTASISFAIHSELQPRSKLRASASLYIASTSLALHSEHQPCST